MTKVNPIPPGFRTVTPHLVLKDAAAAMDWYKKALGAEELCRMPGPGGKGVMHGEIRIGDSPVMLADEFPGLALKAPQSLGGSTVCITLYVTDCDSVYNKAVGAGAKPTMPPADMFWGDRYGKFTDPFGHEWGVATHKEDVPPEEMGKRAEEAMKNWSK